MAIEMTDDEKTLFASVDQFIDRVMKPGIQEFARNHEFPTSIVKSFAEAGFMGIAYDPEYGGAGLGARGAALLSERLAEVEPGFAAIFLCNSAPMTAVAAV